MPCVLLVNPWIDDFAAYDLWARPLGLLTVGAWLERAGADVQLLDCLAREVWGGTHRRFGTGKYVAAPIPPPPALGGVPRRYRRYGAPEAAIIEFLDRLHPPDYILITCLMTYWYPGAFAAARLLRRRYPKAVIILGGVYAFLCPEHARAAGLFDHILPHKDPDALARRLGAITRLPLTANPGRAVYHLYGTPLRHAAWLTGVGCPYRCDYCATPLMYPGLIRKSPADLVAELDEITMVTGARDIAFYDDALLADSEKHFQPFLESWLARGRFVRFHLPNAVHARWLTPDLCALMRRTGFTTIRLGMESLAQDLQSRSGFKVSADEMERGVAALRGAGFTAAEMGAYILFGAPEQTLAQTLADLEYAHRLGLQVSLAAYSPIPGTPDFTRSLVDWPQLADEPLLQNNTLTIVRRAVDYQVARRRMLALNRRRLA
ncbi:MAG: cobalamin-dependent protein [Acidobacteria bacterium]|nr:cobalamin-dependent protein [Acidobacteriota bacterium]